MDIYSLILSFVVENRHKAAGEKMVFYCLVVGSNPGIGFSHKKGGKTMKGNCTESWF